MRFGRHHVPTGRVTLFLAETTVVAVAAALGWEAAPVAGGVLTRAVSVAGCAIAVLGALYVADLYDLGVAVDDARSGDRLVGAFGLLALVSIPAVFAFPVAIRAGLVFALAAAAAASAALRRTAPLHRLRRRIVVVGGGRTAAQLEREVADGLDVVAATCRPGVSDLYERAREAHADAVVVACDDRRGVEPETLLQCRTAGVEVLEALDYVERTRRKLPVELLLPSALIFQDGFRRSRPGDAGRRVLSLAGALLLAVLSAPLALGIALAVKLSSPGPVFYRQLRVGRGGRTFRIWKFRTMRADAEHGTGAIWAQRRDPRVTPLGRLLRRTRLDELPQLLNVLAGDMDLVGPRPERPEFVQDLVRTIPFYELRTLVRPGLTGWAQIRFPYGASVEDARQKLGFDLYYVKHASPLLDLIVLFHTAKVVLTGRGAR